MKNMFGLISLLVVVAVIALLAKKQLSAVNSALPDAGNAAGISVGQPQTGSTVKETSVQIQQQVKSQVDAAMQQPRGEPAEK